MEISGHWTGTIIFGKIYKEYQNKELYFDLELIQNNENISGKAIDIGGIAMNPDPAIINGKIVTNKIQFIKQYISHHYYENGAVKADKSKKGPEIRYFGTYNESDKTLSGDWEIILKVKLFGIIPIKISHGNGTWNMKRK